MGVFLVTGPPNSGKSTLLLSILKEIYEKAEGKVSVATLEDPVEIQMKEFVQFSINPEAGMSYSDAVEQVLTYDQNILLIGEIRDKASAKVVFRASSSGHMTFSTLHARDTLHTFERLRDLDVHPSEMSGHLLGVVSQRLLRRLCSKCKETYDASDDIEKLEKMGYPGFENGRVFRAKKGGCDHCKGRGIKGMVTILEILDTTEKDFRLALSEGKVPMGRLLFLANRQHMRTLFDSGIRRVRLGDVSLEEVVSTVHK
jgi:type II secretory ATPase GspE/PulE/Tfp pilus assembly ATPase PilB-like protein